jgi:putative Holliday junction resolvase
MRVLALDIGLRRTGVAFADMSHGIPLPLPTLRHASMEELAEQVRSVVAARKITTVVVGIPLLPSGGSGKQTEIVRDAVAHFALSPEIAIEEFDERYTTLKDPEIDDRDAAAACQILTTYLAKQSI